MKAQVELPLTESRMTACLMMFAEAERQSQECIVLGRREENGMIWHTITDTLADPEHATLWRGMVSKTAEKTGERTAQNKLLEFQRRRVINAVLAAIAT